MNSDFFIRKRDWSLLHGIPKNVYRSVPAVNSLPPAIKENFSQLIADNPYWQQTVFDDASQEQYILEECSQQVIDAYFQINPAYGPARADFFRYLIIYDRGGVYLDQKSGVSKPLDQLIRPDDRFLLAPIYAKRNVHRRIRMTSNVEFLQWFIVASPGHPYLRAVIQSVLDNIKNYRPLRDDVGKKGVLNVTGPIAYTLAITPLVDQYPHRVIDEREGWVYTTFNSLVTHYGFSRTHYTQLALPVANPSIQFDKLPRLFWLIEAFVARWLGEFRVLNRRRIHFFRKIKNQLKSW